VEINTCLIYAGFQLAVALPAYLFVLPREPQRPAPLAGVAISPPHAQAKPKFPGNAVFLLLAATITLSSVISTTLSVHLLTVLQARGLTLAAAVGLGALVGPSQVAARAVEMVIARYHHPIWTKVASTSLVAIGLAALWLDAPIIRFHWRYTARASGSKASPEARCRSRSSALSAIRS